ncbi:MAG: hypothetical protein RL092_1692, partial [Bacteroidota bacterium]
MLEVFFGCLFQKKKLYDEWMKFLKIVENYSHHFIISF